MTGFNSNPIGSAYDRCETGAGPSDPRLAASTQCEARHKPFNGYALLHPDSRHKTGLFQKTCQSTLVYRNIMTSAVLPVPWFMPNFAHRLKEPPQAAAALNEDDPETRSLWKRFQVVTQ